LDKYSCDFFIEIYGVRMSDNYTGVMSKENRFGVISNCLG